MRRFRKVVSSVVGSVLLAGAAVLAAGSPASAGKTIWEDGSSKLSLFGDARLRLESDHDDRTNADNRDRTRERIRIRTGADYTANEIVSMGFRLRTASDSRQSPHQTLGLYGGAGSNAAFGVDRGFFKLTFGDFHLWGGKNGLPAWNNAEFIWDDDLQPEGLAAGYSVNMGGARLSLGLGHFVIGEGGWDEDDTMLSYQAAIQAGKGISFKAAVGGLSFTDGDEDDAGASSGQMPGGTHSITHVLAEVRAADMPLKPRIGVAYASSDVGDDKIGDGAESEDKTALMAYVRGNVGKVNLRFYYWDNGYAAQPLLGALAQDNFPYSSNFTGYHIQVGYKFFDNLSTDLRYYVQETKNKDIKVFDNNIAMEGDRTRTRIQLNLNVKF
ncbi:MAG: putative porin [Candidatus Nitrospinota bacterium M3_3B_026]